MSSDEEFTAAWEKLVSNTGGRLVLLFIYQPLKDLKDKTRRFGFTLFEKVENEGKTPLLILLLMSSSDTTSQSSDHDPSAL